MFFAGIKFMFPRAQNIILPFSSLLLSWYRCRLASQLLQYNVALSHSAEQALAQGHDSSYMVHVVGTPRTQELGLIYCENEDVQGKRKQNVTRGVSNKSLHSAI